MTEEIEIVTQEVKAKPRKLSAKWTVEARQPSKHAGLSKDELQEQIEETYDRWAWETGAKEDKELLEELEDEREDRSNMKFGLEVEEELIKAISEEIRNDIDKELLDAVKVSLEKLAESRR